MKPFHDIHTSQFQEAMRSDSEKTFRIWTCQDVVITHNHLQQATKQQTLEPLTGSEYAAAEPPLAQHTWLGPLVDRRAWP